MFFQSKPQCLTRDNCFLACFDRKLIFSKKDKENPSWFPGFIFFYGFDSSGKCVPLTPFSKENVPLNKQTSSSKKPTNFQIIFFKTNHSAQRGPLASSLLASRGSSACSSQSLDLVLLRKYYTQVSSSYSPNYSGVILEWWKVVLLRHCIADIFSSLAE